MELSERQEKVLNGILLGRAQIIDSDGRPHYFLRETSDKREYLRWLVEELDDLNPSVYDESLQTQSHEGLTKWRRRWYDGSNRKIPESLEITPEAASLWFARRGEWDETYSRVLIDMEGMRDSIDVATELLVDQGFHAEGARDKILVTDADFLDWLKIEVKGYEKKFER